MQKNKRAAGKKILIIEDDHEIADLISLHLNDLNYDISHNENGHDGLRHALEESFDLIILDLMLPGIDGFEICRRLRKENKYIPILILTSRAEEVDRVLGLELGADDYLTKPFSIRELIARVKALFRRMESLAYQSEEDGKRKKICCRNLEVDLTKRKVTIDGESVDLTVKEFELLEIFCKNPGRAYSRQDLLTFVWGYQFSGYDHTVNSHINRLRAKIEKDPSNPEFIKTVWGHGYRFAEQEELE